MSMCVETTGQRQIALYLMFLYKISHRIRSSTNCLDKLTSKLQQSTCFLPSPPHSSGATDMCHCAKLLHRSWGSEHRHSCSDTVLSQLIELTRNCTGLCGACLQSQYAGHWARIILSLRPYIGKLWLKNQAETLIVTLDYK